MGNGRPNPSHAISVKVTQNLAGKKIVHAVFWGQRLVLYLEDKTVVRISSRGILEITQTK